MKISNSKKLVEKYLIEFPSCRDNDMELISRIWWNESSNKLISFKDFLLKFKEGDFSHPESIMRCRRKLQENRIELRGESYRERQLKQREVIIDLNTNLNK